MPTWESDLLATGLRASQVTGVADVADQVSGKRQGEKDENNKMTVAGYLSGGGPATSGKSGSECFISRPVPDMQAVAAGAQDGYQDAMGETRQDRSDNVTGNWTQVNSSDVNAVII